MNTYFRASLWPPRIRALAGSVRGGFGRAGLARVGCAPRWSAGRVQLMPRHAKACLRRLGLALGLLSAFPAGAAPQVRAPKVAALAAAGPFKATAAELLAAVEAEAPLSPRSSSLLLWYETELRFEADGRVTTRLWTVYSPLTAEGVRETGNVGTTWRPDREKHPVVRARVITTDGREHPFDGSTLQASALFKTGPVHSGRLDEAWEVASRWASGGD